MVVPLAVQVFHCSLKRVDPETYTVLVAVKNVPLPAAFGMLNNGVLMLRVINCLKVHGLLVIPRFLSWATDVLLTADVVLSGVAFPQTVLPHKR
jgi:hypothetical protein